MAHRYFVKAILMCLSELVYKQVLHTKLADTHEYTQEEFMYTP